MCLFIGCPSTVVLALLKVASNQIGGVDIPITIFFSIASTFLFSITTKSEVQLIKSLVSPLMNDTVGYKFISRVRFAYYSVTFAFTTSIYILNFLPIVFPNIYNGTNGYPRSMVVVGKNITAILFLSAVSIMYKLTTDEAERILQGSAKIDKKTNAVEIVIRKLHEEHKTSIKKLVVGIIIYGVFSMPQLWGYASVPFGVAVILASGTGVSYCVTILILYLCIYVYIIESVPIYIEGIQSCLTF